jgi:NADP-dependent 3-hydroxy acid dehydrogenase YdfG
MTPKKIALVVGAGSGMGRLHAQRLVREGYTVVAADQNLSGLDETALGHEMILEVVDVTDGQAVEAMVARVEAELGPIDSLHHTAAIMPTSLLVEQDPALISKVMRVNYDGTVHVALAVVPRMRARGRGVAVFYGSIAGIVLTPHMGAYGASKAAVNAFVEILLEECRGSGVAIHLVCPPMVATPLIEQALSTSNPKSFAQATEQKLFADPGDIVQRVEAGVAKGEEIILPSTLAKALTLGRRLAPGFVWKLVRRAEQM